MVLKGEDCPNTRIGLPRFTCFLSTSMVGARNMPSMCVVTPTVRVTGIVIVEDWFPFVSRAYTLKR